MTLHLGIFLVTLSGLTFEIGLTRIFSATIWYHFAFVAISVALLGWGLGGFALHVLKKRMAFSLERAAVLTLLYALAIPFCLWMIVRLPFHPDRLAFYFLASLLPFLLAGMALSMVFDLRRAQAGELYFADLLGASGGALLVTFLLSWLGGENAILAVAIAPLVAATCFARRLLPASAAGLVLVFLAVSANERTGLFKIKSAPAKGMYRHMAATPDAKVALTGWNDPAVGRTGGEHHPLGLLVPGAAFQGRAQGRADPDHRARRRLGCAGRPGRGQPEGDRGGDEPAHAPLRAPLRGRGGEPL